MAPPKTDNTDYMAQRSPAFLRFFADHGRFPTRDECRVSSPARAEYGLVDYRTIERRFGGAVAFRTLLGIPDADTRRSRSHRDGQREAGARHAAALVTVNAALVARYGKASVHREESYTDDERRRTDFRVFGGDDESAFIVDVLVPMSRRSQDGCVRTKVRKIFDVGHHLDAPVLLVDAGIGSGQPFSVVQPADDEFNFPVYSVGVEEFMRAVDDAGRFPFAVVQ